MRLSTFLVFTRAGSVRAVRGKAGRPALKANEFAVYVALNVPEGVFAPKPIPAVALEVPASYVLEPVPVEGAVLEAPAVGEAGGP